MSLEISEIGVRMRVGDGEGTPDGTETSPAELTASEREALVHEVVERVERNLKNEEAR